VNFQGPGGQKAARPSVLIAASPAAGPHSNLRIPLKVFLRSGVLAQVRTRPDVFNHPAALASVRER